MSDTPANPYSAPTSVLQDIPAQGQVPSIEQALSRGYDFNIGDVISESWSLVKGSKGIFIGGLLVFYVVVFAATFAASLILGFAGLLGAEDSISYLVTSQLISSLVTAASYPFMAGIFMISLRRASNQPISFDLVFSQFGKFVPLLIAAILMSVLMMLGFVLLIIPGIYLAVAYSLTIPLIAERNLSPWQAMEASRKAIHQHWFKVFGMYILLSLIVALSIIPIGIGLIWSVPLLILCSGVLYRIIFGVLPAAN